MGEDEYLSFDLAFGELDNTGNENYDLLGNEVHDIRGISGIVVKAGSQNTSHSVTSVADNEQVELLELFGYGRVTEINTLTSYQSTDDFWG